MSASGTMSATGLLLSGGIDSSVLLGHFLQQARPVQPFHIRSDVCWLREEMQAVQSVLEALKCEALRPLVVLDLPLADLYQTHWSITGDAAPDHDTTDDAVYLPGRNSLLTMKAAVWCQMHKIRELAIATLCGNPFPDATERFFVVLAEALSLGSDVSIQFTRPFGHLRKPDILRLGRELPLELTFSCIDPADHRHCGRCNKCAERHRAFREAGLEDPTSYAANPAG